VIIFDASAAVDLLLQIQPNASVVSEKLGKTGETLHVPHIFDAEVVQALRRYSLRKELSAARARQALDDLEALRLFKYPYMPLLPRVWQLRAHFTAFDAAYVALAELLGAPLVTSDRRLGRAGGHRATVEVVP
jgi:predicted nucleic acid-binding protein